jgi:choline kinase
MGALTRECPKCMLPVQGRSILEHTVARMREAGCSEITVVTGYLAERVRVPGVERVYNAAYEHNNILHSLMTARAFLEGTVLISYGDILVEPGIYHELAKHRDGIVLAVDRDWRDYYADRPGVRVEDSETALFDHRGRLVRIGKDVDPDRAGPFGDGEFLGLWSMREPYTGLFRDSFEALDARLAPHAPFRGASSWLRAGAVELIQELVDRGHPVRCALVERGWAEIDTAFDYARLPRIAAAQKLESLRRSGAEWGLATGTRAAGAELARSIDAL